MNSGQIFCKINLNSDLSSFELMLEQRQRVADDLIEVGLAKLGGWGAGEIQQATGDLRGAEALLRNLFKHRTEASVTAQLLGEHLRVRRDDGERRVDFVSYAGGEKSDGTELVGLGELILEGDALGDVVDEDDATDDDEFA